MHRHVGDTGRRRETGQRKSLNDAHRSCTAGFCAAVARASPTLGSSSGTASGSTSGSGSSSGSSSGSGSGSGAPRRAGTKLWQASQVPHFNDAVCVPSRHQRWRTRQPIHDSHSSTHRRPRSGFRVERPVLVVGVAHHKGRQQTALRPVSRTAVVATQSPFRPRVVHVEIPVL